MSYLTKWGGPETDRQPISKDLRPQGEWTEPKWHFATFVLTLPIICHIHFPSSCSPENNKFKDDVLAGWVYNLINMFTTCSLTLSQIPIIGLEGPQTWFSRKPYFFQHPIIITKTLKDCEGFETLPTYTITIQPAIVSWILVEERGLQG